MGLYPLQIYEPLRHGVNLDKIDMQFLNKVLFILIIYIFMYKV